MSINSKVHKSAAWKRRKREQHEENQKLRAELHAQKPGKNHNERAVIQAKIDEISKRGSLSKKRARQIAA